MVGPKVGHGTRSAVYSVSHSDVVQIHGFQNHSQSEFLLGKFIYTVCHRILEVNGE